MSEEKPNEQTGEEGKPDEVKNVPYAHGNKIRQFLADHFDIVLGAGIDILFWMLAEFFHNETLMFIAIFFAVCVIAHAVAKRYRKKSQFGP